MSGAALTALIFAILAAILVPVELIRSPFRSVFRWARRWLRLIRQLPRLDQAVEIIASWIAQGKADLGATEEEHQQAIQGLHDYLTARRDAEGLRLKPRSPFG